MATIVKREGKRGVRWQAGVRFDGQVKWATFRTQGEAKKWAAKIETDIDEGKHFETAEAKKKTVKEMLDRYDREIIPGNKDRRNPLRHSKFWKERIGNTKLWRLRRSLVDQVLTELSEGRMPATVNRYLATLRHACSIAESNWQWLHKNPIGRNFAKSEPRGRVRFLDDKERKALLSACRDSTHPELNAVVLLAMTTGARRGEIMGLRWPDVDLGARRAILNSTKNDERRTLALVPQVVDQLKALRKVRKIDDDRVFSHDDTQIAFRFNRAFKAAIAEAGVADFRFHDLRHTAASCLAMNGATTAEIAAVLGHKTLAMVQRYSHLTDQHVRDVVERTAAKVLADV